MAQKVTGYIKLQIEAGKATPAPPVGPALGQKGVNIMAFTKEFNERTKNQMGYVIPVVITVYADRSILRGVTRKSAIELLKSWGVPVEERLLSVDELFDAAASGALEEAWCIGTAAVISPIGELSWGDRDYKVNDNKIGALSQKLYDELTGIQWGTKPDPFGWVCPID